MPRSRSTQPADAELTEPTTIARPRRRRINVSAAATASGGIDPHNTDREAQNRRRIDELTESLMELRHRYTTRHETLSRHAASRSKLHKWLLFGSGVVATGSAGTATTALIAEWSGPYSKGIAAGLAFASAMISLALATLLDQKETQRMFEGAAAYGAFEDRALAIYDQRYDRSPDQLAQVIDRLRTDDNKLDSDYGPLLPKSALGLHLLINRFLLYS